MTVPDMHKYLVYAAFGTLTSFGILHFLIDVVSQHFRGLRQPGPATDLYYGLHSAYGLGQAAFGAMGLYVAWRAMPIMQEWPPLVLALLAGLGWLATCLFFIEYTQPRLPIVLYCGLMLAALFTLPDTS
jgi:hypothetical protein